MTLPRQFYQQDGVSLGRALVGKILVRNVDNHLISTRIVETESYIGPEDKGCHAYNNKKTERTKPMFEKGGHIYVYLIYRMYHCLNIVANKKGKPEAVLIRAVEPLNNIAYLKRNRKKKIHDTTELTNGPGKLCEALKIDVQPNGKKLAKKNNLYILDDSYEYTVESSTRINIDYAEEYKHKRWRFFMRNNRYVSQ